MNPPSVYAATKPTAQPIGRDRSHRVFLVPQPVGVRIPQITHTVILPASLRYRLLSEMRAAVCPTFGSVFVLWQEGAPRVRINLPVLNSY